MIKKIFLSKGFYKSFLLVALPIILQQILINSAVIVDNFMIGQLNDGSLTAIAASNGIFLVLMFVMFGINSGSGIFVAQYYGRNDHQGLERAAATKIRGLLYFALTANIVIWLFGDFFIAFFIPQTAANSALFGLAKNYLILILFALFPKVINFGLSTTFQQIGNPGRGVKASLVSVTTNIILNYLFIFGWGPIPAMGLIGAGIGTILSKFSSLFVWLFILDTSKLTTSLWKMLFKKNPLLSRKILHKTIPFITNEFFWAGGMSFRFAIWASYGLDELAALGIQQNITNIVSVMFAGLSGATVFLIGTQLGKNNMAAAKDDAYRLLFIAAFLGAGMFGIVSLIAWPVINIYNISPQLKTLALSLIQVTALWYPLWMLSATFFFILKTGGRTREVLLMDSFHIWAFMIPIALFFRHWTTVSITSNMLFTYASDFIKLAIAFFFFTRFKWLKNLVQNIPKKVDNNALHLD